MYNFLLDQLIYSGSDTMEFSDKQHSLPLLLLFLHLLFFISIAHDDDDLPKRVAASNNKVSALLVFGDSTVDPGNNNKLTTAFKSNFRPYGREFADHMPTGRFSDGRLTTDFVASYLGVKENLPPYLDSTLSIEEMMTGVSFASAGSGYDPLTPRLSNVIPMSKQLQYFREYKKRIESATGKPGTENHIKNAIFIISAGTNDFVVNYYSVPIRRRRYTVTGYHQFLLQQVKDFLQSLLDEGARNIAVVGLPPMGCLPVVISLFSNSSILQRGCVEQYSSVARDYNQMLQNELNLMQLSLANPGARLYYMDVYGPLIDMIQDPAKFGFDKVNVGCCGTGDLETSFLCNPASYVCSDASKYVFWDSIHPTEEAYHNLYKGTRSTVELIVNTSVSITHSPKTGISSAQSSAAVLLLSFYFSLYFFLLYTALLT